LLVFLFLRFSRHRFLDSQFDTRRQVEREPTKMDAGLSLWRWPEAVAFQGKIQAGGVAEFRRAAVFAIFRRSCPPRFRSLHRLADRAAALLVAKALVDAVADLFIDASPKRMRILKSCSRRKTLIH
jgi:hypothetical protein